MPDWDKLTDILKHSSLDRETKLMIIDLLSLNSEPELEEQISELVFKWHAADTAIVDALIDNFDNVQGSYEEGKATAETEAAKQTLKLADEVGREQRIKQIRDEIETL
ncbi:hypothetical protein CO174_05030 [Candidatus Uhrbacteria bacterium CG_4_9_14_3_um_filter_50_9]|uniref:Uncharacterized protein n=1 Tax=Candidatus Uhrbacteria bacterium CG_4_9_14_3_um_filter_50_9 TaxID=1975035 RepID=A0A2M7XBA2_9BACT|nr:MAG: hypothetical protein CO174_05030 [Candidatus Uhrbacteria bacterium CG_4_9_14_3_um_filter_50_9]